LAVHLDNGWDSELAVKNIELLVKKLDIDLYTHVIDWEEFKDLQLAFLYSSTPDSEIPSDHAICALLHDIARKNHTPYIIWGCNLRTEFHLPRAWSQGHMDWKYIKSIHDTFGHKPLKTFPHMDFFSYWHNVIFHKPIKILNYLDYSKKEAIKILENEIGWKYYGGKHYESIYTRFYQGYILPKKFGYDKRRTHMSSLICAGEMTRSEAMEELKKEPYPIELQEADKQYVIKKLGITDEIFERIMKNPQKRFEDYPSFEKSIYKSIFFRLPLKCYKKIQEHSSLELSI